MGYVIGLDGGGTKTRLCAIDKDKKILFTLEGSSMNLNGTSEQSVKNNIKNLLHLAMEKDKDILSICVGVAGISNPKVTPTIVQALREGEFGGNIKVVGDHEAALAGAFGGEDGIMLISGTGSICIAKHGDKVVRAGGYGHILDDEGSGYAIGKDVLRAVVYACDNRAKATVLTQMVFDEINIDNLNDLLPFVYKPNCPKSDIARFAKLLPDACAQQDAAALAIQTKATQELFKLVNATAMLMQNEKPNLCLYGSILQKYDGLRNEFVQMCAQSFEIKEPLADADFGAATIALSIIAI